MPGALHEPVISPDYRARVVTVLNASCLLVLPVVCESLWEGHYLLAGSFLVMIGLILLNGRRLVRGRRPLISPPVLTLLTIFVQALAVWQNGALGIWWVFPAIVFFFLVQSRRSAAVSSLLLIAVTVPIAFRTAGAPPSARLLATALLFVVVSNTFLKIIGILEARLKEQARTDPLTGAFNRRHLQDCLAEALERFARHATPSSMVMFDLDHFKKVNDELGHDAGDGVLRSVTSLVSGRLRSTDLLFRIGGEEFLILLGDTGLANAAGLAEELRGQIVSAQILPDRKVTVSMGVSEVEAGDTASSWMSRTDELLYRAKRQGRDQVVASTAMLRP